MENIIYKHLLNEAIKKMEKKDLLTTISDMISEKVEYKTKENIDNDSFDISYEDGIKYFGNMMERILSSIKRIESNFEKMRDLN